MRPDTQKLNSTKLLGKYIERRFDPKTLPRNSSKTVPGIYYHGIILSGKYGFYAILNILESGMLQTPNYVAYWDPTFASLHHSVRDQDIKDLKYKQNSGGLTPTAIDNINIASGIRQGLHIQYGPNKIGDYQEKEIINRSKIEIKFEIERRKFAKNAVSRFECLYVADNESIIKDMFHYDPDLLILKVKIAEALNYTKVDSRWYDDYCDNKRRKSIKRYWNGQKYDEYTSSWEYLVDGLIIVDELKGLAYMNSMKTELEQKFKGKISGSQEKEKRLIMAYN
jgi:hypothetical protein